MINPCFYFYFPNLPFVYYLKEKGVFAVSVK